MKAKRKQCMDESKRTVGDTNAGKIGDSPDMWGAATVKTLRESGRGDWFHHDKFGMFIHWGLYSEAAGVWNGKTYFGIAEWLMRQAQIPAREYAALADRFNPTEFNAEALVRLAKSSGMSYIVITAKHHDGFAMFESQSSTFNICHATPFRRDPIRELADACRREGMRLGFYYSQYQDWHEPDAAGNTWDFPAPGNFDRYLRNKALPQIRELLTNYGPVALMWFDTPGSISPEASQELLDLVRKLQPDCLVNSRIGNGLGDYATLGDQEVPLTAPSYLWETIDTHNDTWGFARNDHNWKTARELISRLLRVVALGGNYMLNVGPNGSGVIPAASENILREVGAWLKRNGESLYGTRRSPLGQQPWGCSSLHADQIYLHVLNWPNNKEMWVPGIGAATQDAHFLSTGKKVKWSRVGKHLRIALPVIPPDTPATVIALKITSVPAVTEQETYLHPGLINKFDAQFAELKDCSLGRRSWMEKFGDWHHADVIEDWKTGSEASWEFTAIRNGRLHVYADYECWAEADNSEFEISVSGQRWLFPSIYTGGGKGLRTRFQGIRIGLIDIPVGAGRLSICAHDIKGKNMLAFRRIVLAWAE